MGYESVTSIASINSEDITDGFVAVAGSKIGSINSHGTLRFLLLERLEEVFNQKSLGLRYTPRRILVYPEAKLLISCEAEQGILSPYKESNVQSGFYTNSLDSLS